MNYAIFVMRHGSLPPCLMPQHICSIPARPLLVALFFVHMQKGTASNHADRSLTVQLAQFRPPSWIIRSVESTISMRPL